MSCKSSLPTRSRTINFDSNLVRRVMRKPFDITEFIDEVLACAAENGH